LETLRGAVHAEVAAAAAADPDARSMSEEEFQRARKVSRARTLRRALGLTQEEFAGHYHIPISTLRDWEQGRSELDQYARPYLAMITQYPLNVSIGPRERFECARCVPDHWKRFSDS
jgi:putative transcriptional regulator